MRIRGLGVQGLRAEDADVIDEDLYAFLSSGRVTGALPVEIISSDQETRIQYAADGAEITQYHTTTISSEMAVGSSTDSKATVHEEIIINAQGTNEISSNKAVSHIDVVTLTTGIIVIVAFL